MFRQESEIFWIVMDFIPTFRIAEACASTLATLEQHWYAEVRANLHWVCGESERETAKDARRARQGRKDFSSVLASSSFASSGV